MSTSLMCIARAVTTEEQLDLVAERGYELVRWRRRNLFFGGAAAVEMLPDGTEAAAGDPRRGGAGVLVS